MADYNDYQVREELPSCKHSLVDSEHDRDRRGVFNFAPKNNTPIFLHNKIVYVYKKLNCAAKINFALGFVFCNVADVSYRYYYAHEVTIFLEGLPLLAYKNDLTDLQKKTGHQIPVEMNAREKTSTKWKFLLGKNVTIFAAFLKSVPMDWKVALLLPSLVERAYVTV